MGVAIAPMRLRESVANTAAATVESFNAVHDLIVATGMTQCTDAEFAGQAGVFVVGGAGAGQTAVALGTTSGLNVVGFKVYKHPVLALYMHVQFIDVGNQTSASRHAAYRFMFGTSIAAGTWAGTTSPTISPVAMYTGGNPLTTTVVSNTARQMYASCGADHFWMYHDPTSLSVTTVANSTTNATLTGGLSVLAIGVFAGDVDPRNLMVVTGVNNTSSGGAWAGVAFGNYNDNAGTRYWTCNTIGGAWTYRGAGAAGSLPDPATTNNANGVRVSRAQLHFDGVLNQFDFGFINMGAVTDMTAINMNLTGNGAKTYRSVRAFGPSNHSYAMMSVDQACSPIFPWAE